MKNFIKKILVSFGYRSLGLDHNNEHSKWAKPIGHCILIAEIIDEKQIELRSIFRSAKTKELCGWATRIFEIYETEDDLKDALGFEKASLNFAKYEAEVSECVDHSFNGPLNFISPAEELNIDVYGNVYTF